MKLPLPPIPLPGPLPEPVLELLLYGGKKLIDKFLGDKTEPLPAYSPENSEADEIMAVNTALFDYREEVKQAAADLEGEMKKICEEAFTQVIESLEEANEECDFYRPNSLKRKLEYFLQELGSIVDTCVAKRISLDDTECLAILKMRPGESREQRMRELKRNVFKESIGEINRQLNRFTNDFFEDIEFSINHRLSELAERQEELVAAFEIASKDKDEHSDRLENHMIQAGYVMDVVSLSQNIPR